MMTKCYSFLRTARTRLVDAKQYLTGITTWMMVGFRYAMNQLLLYISLNALIYRSLKMARELGIKNKKTYSGSTPEGKVKAKIKRALDSSERIWYFMPASNGLGRKGIPDFIVCLEGNFFAIETKADNGKLTALQQREINKINISKGLALVVTGEVEAQYIADNLERRMVDVRPITSRDEVLSALGLV